MRAVPPPTPFAFGSAPCARSMRRTLAWLPYAALSSAVVPRLSLLLASAPAASSDWTAAASPRPAASRRSSPDAADAELHASAIANATATAAHRDRSVAGIAGELSG